MQDRAAAVGQSAFGVQDVQRVVADIVPTHPWQPKYWVRPQSLLEGPHVQLRREPHARICGAVAEEAASAFIPWGARSYLSLFLFLDFVNHQLHLKSHQYYIVLSLINYNISYIKIKQLRYE